MVKGKYIMGGQLTDERSFKDTKCVRRNHLNTVQNNNTRI